MVCLKGGRPGVSILGSDMDLSGNILGFHYEQPRKCTSG